MGRAELGETQAGQAGEGHPGSKLPLPAGGCRTGGTPAPGSSAAADGRKGGGDGRLAGLRGQPGTRCQRDRPSTLGTISPFPGAEAVAATSLGASGSWEAQEQARGTGGDARPSWAHGVASACPRPGPAARETPMRQRAPVGAPAALKQGQASPPRLSNPDTHLDPHTLPGRGGVFTNTLGLCLTTPDPPPARKQGPGELLPSTRPPPLQAQSQDFQRRPRSDGPARRRAEPTAQGHAGPAVSLTRNC